jgi:hypothetical protein
MFGSFYPDVHHLLLTQFPFGVKCAWGCQTGGGLGQYVGSGGSMRKAGEAEVSVITHLQVLVGLWSSR